MDMKKKIWIDVTCTQDLYDKLNEMDEYDVEVPLEKLLKNLLGVEVDVTWRTLQKEKG